MKRLIVIAGLASVACVVPAPKPSTVPVPPVVVPAAAVGENLTVVGPSGQVEGARAVLAGDDGAIYTAMTDVSGRAGLVVQSTGGSTLTVTADGYQPAVSRIAFCSSTCELPTVTLERLPPAHLDAGERGWLHRDGTIIRTEDGQAWSGRGFSDFRLLEYFCAGQDVSGLLDERIGYGANYLRVFARYDGGIGHWTLTDPGCLDRFLDLTAAAGERVEVTVLADAQALSQAQQRALVDLVAPVLARHWNALGEIANEYANNGVDPAAFDHPAGQTLWSRGSGTGDAEPFLPPWDVITDHPGRDTDWPRRMNCRYISDTWQRPCLEDEPIGAADVEVPGRRSATPIDFKQWGVLCTLQSAGCLFHSDNGVQSTTLSPAQAASARAYFEGARFPPAAAQTWPYQRGDQNSEYGIGNMPILHDDAIELRSYCKSNGGAAWCVQTRTTRAHATPRDGWRIVEEPAPGLTRLAR